VSGGESGDGKGSKRYASTGDWDPLLGKEDE
jgi:hypothetical protein